MLQQSSLMTPPLDVDGLMTLPLRVMLGLGCNDQIEAGFLFDPVLSLNGFQNELLKLTDMDWKNWLVEKIQKM